MEFVRGQTRFVTHVRRIRAHARNSAAVPSRFSQRMSRWHGAVSEPWNTKHDQMATCLARESPVHHALSPLHGGSDPVQEMSKAVIRETVSSP